MKPTKGPKTPITHTPGPWTALEPQPRLVYSGKGSLSEVICTTNAENPNRYADARLIAASPDLLAALRESQGALVQAINAGHLKSPLYSRIVGANSAAILRAGAK